jgi:hypothetical protein
LRGQPDSYGQYLLNGGDIVQLFMDRCRLRGQTPFISFRLNDGHHKEWVDAKPGDKIDPWAIQGVTRFYRDHPEYRIGPDLHDWSQRVQNWAIPEVRAHKLAFIQELCENYDFEGLELDFMRYFSYFQLGKTTSKERAAIMTSFIGQVRELLNHTSRDGKHRWLCARVPAFIAAWDPMGIDLPAMVGAGLDMVNLSTNYFTAQQTDLPAIRRMIPQASVYNEMTHVTWNGKPVGGGYDSRKDRRTTPEQYYTTANLAYARGADGMCLFNFAYYREYGEPYRGPFGEPPFFVLPHLKEKGWLAKQPQHYFLSRNWKTPYFKQPLPQEFKPGQSVVFPFDMAPPEGGWSGTGHFRIQGEKSLEESRWEVKINGAELKPTENRAEPYPNTYTQLLGKPEELRAWDVAAELLRNGENQIEITLQTTDSPQELYFLDLWIAGKQNS